MKPFDIGFDADAVMRAGGHGRVQAVFSRAVYVNLPAGLLALTTGAVARGPLHVRVPQLPLVAPGDPVIADRTAMRVGGQRVLLPAPVWRAQPPVSISQQAARASARPWCQTLSIELGELRHLVDHAVREALGRADLRGLGRLIVGRGPGLTPAGDDLLAGALLVAHAIGASTADEPNGPRVDGMFDDVVTAGATNDIARAFLRCAAHGRCIEPAHDFLNALARADREAARRAVARLRRFGSSSGLALAYGIALALVELPYGRSDQLPGRAARMVNVAIG